ncbi:protein NO VEIN-like [Protopterus annectens]|uniref:protein NO VEIN-like n=1 Tax=Protopterus annectens TaxID=7888 RepID=UPI001CF9CAE4|nr:protein NO VEIN-like [Protopterus annectens]
MSSFEAVRTVCTLHELGQCLAALKNKKRFEELCLGPICKQPLIHKMFKVPGTLRDEDIVQIDTVDILKSLRSHMRKIGPRSKVDLAEFMKFLADQYNCESPYELGIRIQSIALSISTVRKAANSEFVALEKAKDRIRIEIEEEVENRMYKIKKNLLDCASGPNLFSNHGSYELRRQYSTLTATEAVFQVCRNAQDIFSGKLQKTVQDFLGKVQTDRLARSLFQLAICCGSLDVPNDLVAKECAPSKPSPPDKEADSGIQPPSDGALKEYLLKQLQSLSGFLTLAFLSRCEKKIVEHFKFKAFANMGLGTFLEYLVKHSQCLQEVGGGSFFLTAQDAKVCGFRASQQDVCDLIHQCGALDQSKFQAVESALKSHFQVRDVRDLGYGSLSSLVSLVQKQNKLTNDHVSQKNIVVYEASIFVKDASSVKMTAGPTYGDAKNSVGLLGELSKDQALACLLNAPLLKNLAEWSQWEFVFEPLYGPLKEFIEKNCRRKVMDIGCENFAVDLVALEVSPGVLLRLTTKTSPDHFAEAAKSCDPAATAGHLVSIIVGDGLTSAPLALLANHLETALATLDIPEVFSTAETGATSRCAKFILDCLVKIPTRLCVAVMQQVFLEPFSRVVGQAISRELLLQASKSCDRYRNTLHVLGIQLGITEWVKDFHTELEPPKHLTVKTETKKHKAADETSTNASSISLISEEEEEECEEESEDDEYVVTSESESEDEVIVVSSDDEEEEEQVKFELAAEVKDSSHPVIKMEKVDEEPSVEIKPEEVQEKSIVKSETELELGDTCTERESFCRAVVEKIRKEEFGVGVHLNEEGQKLMDVHQSRLGRSLERLSKELYSKDTHFVLELIQNADDNCYPENEEMKPALVFVVEKTTVYLLNNECGFEEENIKAICDIGRSTKGRHVYGYIGQKGIGFKSVFKVSDCPAIHSNGFHIYFDKNSGPLGYILPHWLDDEIFVDLSSTGLDKGSWTTTIILPLKSESYQTRNLFHDVHPSLLLFLHRLRSVTVVDKVEGKVLSMVRKDLKNNILEVQYGDKADRWFVVKKTLRATNIKENVESTELALAFKTKLEGRGLGFKVQPEKQPVFAFLPLRSFGFRFIVQGDFDIPSSREDVDRDSPWNQWLRSEIPLLFLEAMETFTAHPDFKGLEGVCQFLNFVPLPDEILDFFKPVAGQIIQLLKSKPILPTKKDKDGSIEYRLPSQTAVPFDHLVEEVITSEMLSKHLNLSYLHPLVHSSVPATLLAVLGVHRLSSSDVIAVTKAVAKELEQSSSKCNAFSLKNIAKLLVCCYRSLEQEYNMSDHILEELKLVPIIPLVDGRILSVKDQAVFFPLDESQGAKKGVQELYKDLSIVNPFMLECLDPLQNSQVRDLLKKLDVHQLEPEKVIFEHIRPVLLNEVWKVKTPDIVKSYAIFLKLHCRQEELLKFKSYLPVFTNKDFVSPSVNKVHFTKDYKNIDLPSKLPGVDWVLLDSCYVNFDNDVDGWRRFFSVFGVEDCLILRKEKRKFTKKELLFLEMDGASSTKGASGLSSSCGEVSKLVGQLSQLIGMLTPLCQSFVSQARSIPCNQEAGGLRIPRRALSEDGIGLLPSTSSVTSSSQQRGECSGFPKVFLSSNANRLNQRGGRSRPVRSGALPIRGDFPNSTEANIDNLELFNSNVKVLENDLYKLQRMIWQRKHLEACLHYKLIPRGMRILCMPTYGDTHPTLLKKWQDINIEASHKYMRLLIDYFDPLEKELLSKVNDTNTELRDNFPDPFCLRKLESMYCQVNTYAMKLQQTKLRKLQRDFRDFSTGGVFVWPRRSENYHIRENPVSSLVPLDHTLTASIPIGPTTSEPIPVSRKDALLESFTTPPETFASIASTALISTPLPNQEANKVAKSLQHNMGAIIVVLDLNLDLFQRIDLCMNSLY